MKQQIKRGIRRAGVFAAMTVALLLALVMAVALFGIQFVFGLLNKVIR